MKEQSCFSLSSGSSSAANAPRAVARYRALALPLPQRAGAARRRAARRVTSGASSPPAYAEVVGKVPLRSIRRRAAEARAAPCMRPGARPPVRARRLAAKVIADTPPPLMPHRCRRCRYAALKEHYI